MLERFALTLFLAVMAAAPALAQREGDQSIDPPDDLDIPEAKVLSAEESMATFVVEEGFEVQLVADEALVEDPVCMAWDAAGRLWVCEMRGYMADQFAKTEEEPTGQIVILEDTDADGRMDKRTVWMDKIILPRAIAFANNGVLYADYQSLYFVRLNPDGSAGARIPVDRKYSDNHGGKSNVEHQANGLLYGLDNWYYSAKSSKRYKQVGTRFRPNDTEFRGQWGITQDDQGRLLTNHNSNLIYRELLPPNATIRNDNFTGFKPPLVTVSKQVYPIRPTPGVNRAYNPNVVDHATWKLKVATAACGPVIYRGTQFPAEYYNNVFVPEPAGHLLKRVILEEDDQGKPTARQAYEGREFLASTDERCRFVNAYTGPDGALYVVDLYRGLIQHQTYISEYLRRQINERGLDKPIGLGRIYRVVHKDSPIDHNPPKLSEMSGTELVALLSHPNAWHRMTAQRLLVERRDSETVLPLQQVATSSENPQARIHALWALDGMRELTPNLLATAGQSKDERVRVQVLRLAEQYGGTEDAKWFVPLLTRYSEGNTWQLDLQLALSAGVLAGIDTPEAYDVLLALIERRGDDALFRKAVISGLEGKEAVMLAKIESGPIKKELTGALVKAVENGNLSIGSLLALVDSPDFAESRNELLQSLASQAVEQGRSEVLAELIDRMAKPEAGEASQVAVLTGMVEGRRMRSNNAQLDGKPALFERWQADPPEALAELVAQLDEVFDYEITVVSADVAARIEAGQLHYSSHCSTCHGEDGKGLEGAGPPLYGSDWLVRSPEMLSLLVLNGLEGPITVNGKLYEPPSIQAVMAGFKSAPMSDQDLADILTFLRSSEMGNRADPVDAEVVAAMREATKNRTTVYTPEELLAIDGGGEAPGGPDGKVVVASWLKNSSLNLLFTLGAVTVPLVLLLLLTMFGGGRSDHAH